MIYSAQIHAPRLDAEKFIVKLDLRQDLFSGSKIKGGLACETAFCAIGQAIIAKKN